MLYFYRKLFFVLFSTLILLSSNAQSTERIKYYVLYDASGSVRGEDHYFRGRRMDLPNFNHKQITEIAFFIGNK